MANRRGVLDVPDPIAKARSEPLGYGELTLKQLAAPPDGAEWVALNEEKRRVGGQPIPPTGANLFCQGFMNARAFSIGGLRKVGELCCGGGNPE
jgi:hypothetical protein